MLFRSVFVLLTHNAHFFLNARPYRWQPGDKKVSCFTLTKENSTTAIQKITAPTDDIKTGYEALWHELHFAYNNDRPMSMLNILRRIIDSFADFNCTDSLDGCARSLAQKRSGPLPGRFKSVVCKIGRASCRERVLRLV